MGCCTSQFTDSELENAETLQEVISVMKKRSEDLEKEKKWNKWTFKRSF